MNCKDQKVIHFQIMMSSTIRAGPLLFHSGWVPPHLVFLQLQTGRQPGCDIHFLKTDLCFF